MLVNLPFKSLLFYILFFFTTSALAEQEYVTKTVELTAQDLTIISETLIWRELPKHQYPINFVAIERLLPASEKIQHSIRGSSGAYLAKISLRTPLYLPNTWYINPHSNFVDKGIAFWQKSDGNVIKLADFSQFSDNKIPVLMHSQAFSLTLEPFEEGVLWLYIDAKEYTYPLDLKIYNESAFYRYQFINNLVTYITLTVMLTLALFASIIYCQTKQKITLTCAAYIGLMGAGWSGAAGLMDDIFSIAWFNTTYAGYLLFPLAKGLACQFTKQLFNCEQDFPQLAKFLNRLTISLLVLTAFMPLIDFSTAYRISHMVAILWLPMSIAIGLTMLKQKDFRAKYYLTGNLLYALTLTYYMLTHTTLVESVLYPELLVLTALALDCVCISLSLAEWLHLKQRDYNRNFYLARIDPLTHIANRYALNEKLEKLSHHFVIVFIDFDGVKEINDNLGHDQGDAFLTEASTLMRNNIDKLGTVFRTGGDEFVWLFEVKKAKQIDALVQSIAELIEHSEQVLKSNWPMAGISFGVASSLESRSQSECLTLADERMYQYKRSKKKHLG